MKNSAIGIDIGGTKICACVVQDGQIISETVALKTPKTSPEILKTIFEAIEILKAKHNVQFVGIATAGTVNLENSAVTGSTGNLPEGYGELNFKQQIEEKYNLKTFIENDANAAAYAEYKEGAAKGDNHVILLTLGTGIGGGIIVNGEIIRGKSGVGAECGHIPLSWNRERKCTCGAWDCWEAYASGTGFALNAREMALKLDDFKTSFLKDKNPQELTTYDILDGLKRNDEFSKKVYDRWQELLLMGMVALVNIFDPDSVVLSGGMAKFVDYDYIQKEVDKRVVISKTKILHAAMENSAGMVGSAILALEKFGV